MFAAVELVFAAFEHVFSVLELMFNAHEHKILRCKNTYFFLFHQIIPLRFASFKAENKVFPVNIRFF